MKLKNFRRSLKKSFSLSIDSIAKLPKIFILLLFSLVCLGIGLNVKDTPHSQVWFGLVSELIGAALTYWLLDSSIKQLYGISELPDLPIEDFVEDIAQVQQIRILETFSSLVRGTHYEKFV
jgi:hypothetical protein